MKRLKITIHKLSKTMNWNKFLPCILFGSLLGACSGKGEQPKVEPTTPVSYTHLRAHET